MTTLIRSHDRGFTDHGWLKAYHTFSFADYYNPNRTGFASLRVINEDRIDEGMGFSTHPHRDMEIITYLIEGELKHKDSMGTEAVIKPNEIQRMSAGTGVLHSEFNYLHHQKTHLLQIWILPQKLGVTPSYEQKSFKEEFRSGDLVLLVSQNGQNGSVSINQDVNLYACKANADREKVFSVSSLERKIWIQNIKGHLKVNEDILNPGDGVGLKKIESIALKWKIDSEFLLFDLA